MKVFGLLLCLVAAVAANSRSSDGGFNGTDHMFVPQTNYDGWVSPEDVPPMPQCIAQQDQAQWLSRMTKCTAKRCTRHFWFICTRSQWLTQLSCLGIEFSPDLLRGYLPYCGRSILAKAQLYLWTRKITGRTWIVDVGDANGLQSLTPASLTEGYTTTDRIRDAPTCLRGSNSTLLQEPFQHVVASCRFTSTSQHTGDPAHPWIYSESLRSVVARGFETVGYSLTRSSITFGDYFDNKCFCSTFALDRVKEPCSKSSELDLTRERLWVNATCGPASLPSNWTDDLKTTEFEYIPSETWKWPACVMDMPTQIIQLTDKCATYACELDSSGYCKPKRTVDRACFCRNINYNSCKGSCQIFETRIDYVNWLHALCGRVHDWHGLPSIWHHLAAPNPQDMIPWRWAVKPSKNSDTDCSSSEQKLGSLAITNIAFVVSTIISQRIWVRRRRTRTLGWGQHPGSWFFRGILTVVLHLVAIYLSASLVQKANGYTSIPVAQLVLLWCSIPRPTWFTLLLNDTRPYEAIYFSLTTSSLFTEMVLQVLSSYYMVRTVIYGLIHNIYFGGVSSAEREIPVVAMYAGALLWLVTAGMAILWLIRATRSPHKEYAFREIDASGWQPGGRTTSSISDETLCQLNEYYEWTWKCLIYSWTENENSKNFEKPLLTHNHREAPTVYGTLSMPSWDYQAFQKATVNLHKALAVGVGLFWVAQWLFWIGFIGISAETFCPPKLGIITAIWAASSFGSTMIGATI